MVHVAIVSRVIEQRLVSGCKQIESRLFHSRRPPFGRVRPGDRVYFKRSGGGIFGRAFVRQVAEYEELTPVEVDRLRARYDHRILASEGFWERRRTCRFGVLIWLERFSQNRLPRQYGTAWLTLTTILGRPG